MTENYAELELYHAICSGATLTEGKFVWDSDDEYRKREWFSALDKIRKYLDPNDWRHKSLTISYDSLVESEQEALKLIDFVENTFEGAQGLIVPRDKIHGVLRFFRRIKIPGFVENQRTELTDKLKESGISPNSYGLRNAKYILRSLGESESGLATLKEKEREAWKNALKFY